MRLSGGLHKGFCWVINGETVECCELCNRSSSSFPVAQLDETRCQSLELNRVAFSSFGWFIGSRILHWRRGTDKTMALIGKIEEYNENDSWIEYTERLEQYFAANEITDNNKKRAVLLSVCGAKTYKLIRNLVNPRKPILPTSRS